MIAYIATFKKYMKHSLSGTSIIESLVVMVMVITGVVWLFSIFYESQKLSNSTEQRIQAIQIAREWIEAVENIRDTNWILFSADYKNCWNTIGYSVSCFSNSGYGIKNKWSYTVTRDATNRWILQEKQLNETRDFWDSAYRNVYRVKKDATGFYSQGTGDDFSPIFTREMRFDYIDTDGNTAINSNDEKMQVTAIVSWNDSSSTEPKKIELQTELSNWKNES